ncbi:MAG: ABC transporter ATP-binding protein [Planctomycetes bacterium]|nr:ABC transporter ATP-binding protein [Planctomycetota bacterium]NOG55193.1 ABC transporter ATP-binding protein [Planctomycetota bacterium]
MPSGKPAQSELLISARNVHKTYRLGRILVPVLHGVDLDVKAGEWVAVLGASGSGKSTLLHILGSLDRPDEQDGKRGTVSFHGQDVHQQSAWVQNEYRNGKVGFVFQFYHLLPEMTVAENTALAAMIRLGRFGYQKHHHEIREAANTLLDAFGLGDRLDHRPAELSGGERQRVAIARALMNEPEILLADEPTGNLDSVTGGQILDVVARTHSERGLAIVMVTHDQTVADRADRIVSLESGRIV